MATSTATGASLATSKLFIAFAAGLIAALVAHLSVRKANRARAAAGLRPKESGALKAFFAVSISVYAFAVFWSSSKGATPARVQRGGSSFSSPELADLSEVMQHIDMGDPDF